VIGLSVKIAFDNVAQTENGLFFECETLVPAKVEKLNDYVCIIVYFFHKVTPVADGFNEFEGLMDNWGFGDFECVLEQ
jgi:hypothetical protein